MLSPAFWRILFLVAIASLGGSAALAELPADSGGGPLLVAADGSDTGIEPTTAEQREEVAQQLRIAQRSIPEAGRSDDAPKAPEPTTREVEQLKHKDLLLQQREAAEEQRSRLEQDRQKVQAALDNLRESGLDEERPYSFLLLESLNDSLLSERNQLKSHEAATKAAAEALRRAKEAAEDAGKTRRRTKERADVNQDATKVGELALAAKYATLESELAEVSANLKQIELENQRYHEQTKKLESQLVAEKIAIVEQNVTFHASDLDQQFVELDRQKDAINARLDNNTLARQYLDQQWGNARRRLDDSTNPPPALRAEVEARELAKILRSEQTQVLNDELQWLAPMRQTWERRFRVARGNFSTSELGDWSDSTASLIDELGYDRRLIDARIDGLRSNLASVERRMQATAEDDAQTRRWLRDQQRTLRAGIEFYNDSYIRLDAATRLHEKLQNEIERRTARFSLSQWLAVYWQKVVDVWNYELTSSVDNGITIGKVILGALLLFLGFAISKRVSRFIGRRVLPRFGVQEGAAHALGSLAFYALASCATLMALRLVNVPLTIFTFFGGAVAIGVGFASQRPINNFLSGLLLLTERPVRVGDMIQLGEVTGIVEAIGTRSTRVRTETNLEIIVPNSALMENNVSNWTLSDPTIRTDIKVGVAYGSPTEQVMEILHSVAEQHIRVLDAPDAFAWFTGFGDNALEFELHFYLIFRNLTEQKRIQSELRLEIERRFREAGIVVAYPQRDVHLDTAKPLEIHVARTPPAGRKSA